MTTSATPGLRARLTMGAQAQAFQHVVRVIVQVGGVSVLVASWGLNLYGEWLVLAAVPMFLTFSDIGLFAAATNDMIMKVGREDRSGALVVFQAVSNAVSILFVGLAALLFTATWLFPVRAWLHLSLLSEATASWILLILGLNVLVMMYASVLYGGFACEGRYGEGGFALGAITLVEFFGLAGAALLGGGPLDAAIAMASLRLVGTAAMYARMRYRAPWLHVGRSSGEVAALKRLVSPAIATGAFPAGFALNVQGMLILIGVAVSPASAAIFSTLRTMSRVVIQLLASVFAVISPEISKAYASRNIDLLRTLHRYGCQASIWLAGAIVIVLAAVGQPLVSIWTSGEVDPPALLLYLFLAVTVIDSLWFTSLSVMFATNRHQRLALYYFVSSLVALPVAYGLLQIWGLDGAAAALVGIEVFMLFAVLRQALPAADDTLRDWLRAIARPPLFLTGLFRLRHREVVVAGGPSDDAAPVE